MIPGLPRGFQPPQPGPSFPYAIEGELARGGMGVVYRARDLRNGQPCALKLVLAGSGASEAQRKRFEREAQAQAELDHPNIVRIHMVGEVEGVPYYSMDLVEGPDLSQAFAGMPIVERVRLLAQVARAVHYAHEQGYVHRDLKPSNVLIDPHGQPHLTDFGLVKRLESESKLTKTGAMVGTPHYMSPEQALGDHAAIGPRTDVFALGVILFQLATDMLPFAGETALQLLAQIAQQPAPSFKSRGAQAPELERITAYALEKRPEERYPSAGAFADDLERYLRGERLAASHASRSGLARGLRKHGARMIVGLTALAIALALTVVGIVQLREWGHERASRESARAAIADATRALQQLTAEPRPDPHALDAALTASERALGDGLDEGDTSELRAQLRTARLARAALAWSEETRAAAERGVELVQSVLDDTAADSAQARAQSWMALLRFRLGDEAQAEKAISAIRAQSPDDPRLALFAGRAALAAGEHERAAQLFDRAAQDPRTGDLALVAQALRGRALLHRGFDKDAANAFVMARAPTGADPGSLGEGETLEGLGRARDALAAYSRTLAAGWSLRTAQRLLACAKSQGRPWDAVKALEATAPPDSPGEVLLLRARRDLGLDVRTRLEELSRSPSARGEATLLLADLASLQGDPDPYALAVEIAGPTQAPARAARARWLASRGDGPEAREALKAADDVFHDAVQDAPPSPLLARAVRDLGWARLARGEEAVAASSARAALRGLPGDLDTTALLAKATGDGASQAALRDALLVEAEQLDGPLARGILLARLGLQLESQTLRELALPLLLARLTADPGVFPAQLYLSRLGGEPPPTDSLPWLDLLGPLIEPGAALTEEQTHRVKALLVSANRKKRLAAIEDLEVAARLAPEDDEVLYELAVLRNRAEAGSQDAALLWIRYLRLRPPSTFRALLRFHHGWTFMQDDPDIEGYLQEILAPDPDDPIRIVPSVFAWYFSHLYPDAQRPTWPRRTPEEIRGHIDRATRKDARFVGLLSIRAHLAELAGEPARADRDLEIVRAVARACPPLKKRRDLHMIDLFQAMVYARSRTDQAIRVLESIPETTEGIFQASDRRKLRVWLLQDPALAPLREHGRYMDFVQRRF